MNLGIDQSQHQTFELQNATRTLAHHTLPVILLMLSAFGLNMHQAAAQTYPNKPVRLIVPYPAGGPTDIHSRMVAQQLSEIWNQPVIVENRPGASGMIGTALCARTPPDGYTLCTVTPPFTTSATLNPNMTFSPANDFSPIALLGGIPNILVVHPSLPVKSVKQLVAFAKARPGQLLYPTGGIGGTQWLALTSFEQLSGTKLVPVQYRGTSPALTALVSGEVSVGFQT